MAVNKIGDGKEFYSPIANDFVDEESYYQDVQVLFTNMVDSIYRLTSDIWSGNYAHLELHLQDIEQRLDQPEIANHLATFSLQPESIVRPIYSLIQKIEIAQPFVSPILKSPQLIKELSEEFLLFLTREPELLYQVNPRLFEEIVAEVFRKFKMNVTLTKQTRDGGIDIIAFDDTKYTKNRYIVECKRYAQSQKVGLEIVQRLYGIKISTQATKALLVTSSFFSKDALEFAKQHIWELDLKDHDDVVSWLRFHWGRG